MAEKGRAGGKKKGMRVHQPRKRKRGKGKVGIRTCLSEPSVKRIYERKGREKDKGKGGGR